MKKLFSVVIGLAVLISFASIGMADDFKEFILLPNATRTATVTGATFDTISGTAKIAGAGQSPYGLEAVIYLDTIAASGSSPTLDLVIQDSSDGTRWFPIITFSQVTTAAKVVKRYGTDFYTFGRYVRAVGTIGGTTPSIEFSVRMNIRR